MPCSDGGPTYNEQRVAERDRQIRRLRRLEPLLCSACRALASFNYDFDLNPELSEWWAKHQAEDAEREKAEARKRLRKALAAELAKKSIAELSPEERKILKQEGYL